MSIGLTDELGTSQRREVYGDDGEMTGKLDELVVPMGEPSKRGSFHVPCTTPDGVRLDRIVMEHAHMNPCTLWFSATSNGFEFNHIEDGHVWNEKPVPLFPSQAGWLNMTWKSEHAWLSNGTPPRVVHNAGNNLRESRHG